MDTSTAFLPYTLHYFIHWQHVSTQVPQVWYSIYMATVPHSHQCVLLPSSVHSHGLYSSSPCTCQWCRGTRARDQDTPWVRQELEEYRSWAVRKNKQHSICHDSYSKLLNKVLVKIRCSMLCVRHSLVLNALFQFLYMCHCVSHNNNLLSCSQHFYRSGTEWLLLSTVLDNASNKRTKTVSLPSHQIL